MLLDLLISDVPEGIVEDEITRGWEDTCQYLLEMFQPIAMEIHIPIPQALVRDNDYNALGMVYACEWQDGN